MILLGDYGLLRAFVRTLMLPPLELCEQRRLFPVSHRGINWHAIMLIAAKWSRKLDFRKRPSEYLLRAWVQDHHGCGVRRPPSAERNCKGSSSIINPSFATSTRSLYLHKESCVTFCLVFCPSLLARPSLLATSRDKACLQTTTTTTKTTTTTTAAKTHNQLVSPASQQRRTTRRVLITNLSQGNIRSGCRYRAEQSACYSGWSHNVGNPLLNASTKCSCMHACAQDNSVGSNHGNDNPCLQDMQTFFDCCPDRHWSIRFPRVSHSQVSGSSRHDSLQE